MELLEMKKGSKTLGIQRGYYFKGEFVARLQSEALVILRKRVEHLPEIERNETDEWKIIHAQYLKMVTKAEHTHKAKQPYYAKIGERAKKTKIFHLEERIKEFNRKKFESLEELDQKIKELQSQVDELNTPKPIILCEFCKIEKATESVTEDDTKKSVNCCLECINKMEWEK